MNILQTLDAPTRFLVTLNHADAIDKSKIIQRIAYHHPGVLAGRRRRSSAPSRSEWRTPHLLLRRLLALRLS